MKVSKGVKIFAASVIGIGIILTSAKAAPAALKLKNAFNNIAFDVKFVRLHSISLHTGIVTILFDSIVKNLTGFTIDIENFFVMLESTGNGKDWENFGGSKTRINKISYKDNQTTTTRIPIEIKLNLFLESITKGHTHRFIINYDVSGLQQQYIITKNLSAIFKSISKTAGLGNLLI